MKRLLIAGTKSGVGKTTISMGLMAALSKRMNVQPFKVGPDYIDSAYHSFITGNICRNLDSFLLGPDEIKYFFEKNIQNSDISITEGVMGLFDGAEVGSDIGTSASIAKILDMPVILVVDGSKVASSIAATIKGFELFDKNLTINGVIINNVGSKKHYELLEEAVIYHTGVTPCGYLIKNSILRLPERHLGLVPVWEQPKLKETFDLLANQISETVDIDKILEIANRPYKKESKQLWIYKSNHTVNIAIAMDRAFNFYYQDSLDLLEDYLGVNFIPFSPIEDKNLPENIDGLYLGGGFPEVFAQELSDNSWMIKDIISKLDQGLPYIGECGGLMYLGEELIDLEDKVYKMVGWFSGKTTMTKRLQRFGYAHLTLKNESIFGNPGDKIRIHEFHRSNAEFNVPTQYQLEKIRSGRVVNSWECGYQKKGGIAAYAHFHFGSNLEFAKNFIDRCIKFRNRGN